jgi:cell division protein FtsX
MSIDWFRDLVISIAGVLVIIVLLFIAVLTFLLYRRAKVILDSMKTTSQNIAGISTYVTNEVAKPLIQVVAFIQGVRQGVNAISRLFSKKEGGKKDE